MKNVMMGIMILMMDVLHLVKMKRIGNALYFDLMYLLNAIKLLLILVEMAKSMTEKSVMIKTKEIMMDAVKFVWKKRIGFAETPLHHQGAFR